MLLLSFDRLDLLAPGPGPGPGAESLGDDPGAPAEAESSPGVLLFLLLPCRRTFF